MVEDNHYVRVTVTLVAIAIVLAIVSFYYYHHIKKLRFNDCQNHNNRNNHRHLRNQVNNNVAATDGMNALYFTNAATNAMERERRREQAKLKIEEMLRKQEIYLERSCGIHDDAGYDPEKKAKGPEIQRLELLLGEFVNAISSKKQGCAPEWAHLIAIGDIYRKGAFPRFLPDTAMAIECFKVAAMCPDGITAGTAQWKYIEARDDPLSLEDQSGLQLPTWMGKEACRVALDVIQRTPMSAFEKVSVPKNRNRVLIRNIDTAIDMVPDTVPVLIHQYPNGQDVHDMFTTLDDMLRRDRFQYHNTATVEGGATETQRERVIDVEHMHDRQNVHDHSVMAITQSNIAKLITEDTTKKCHVRRERELMFDQLTDYILQHPDLSEKIKLDALKTLSSVAASGVHSTIGVSEAEALRLVWGKIESMKDKQVGENLKETLVQQLASSVEHGHVVCSTGKISRIMGALEGAVVEESVRPMWIVRDEIANLASKTRDEFLRGLSQDDVKAYESGNLPNLESEMKVHFEKEVMRTYRDTLGMKESILRPIVNTVAEGF